MEFKKEQRILGMKQKNNFLAHANVRETEHMAKRARIQVEPSEQRYENHLQDINTPQKEVQPAGTKCDSDLNSMKNTAETSKKEDDETESKLVDPESADAGTVVVAKRKGFLSFLV